jgi:DNA-binding NtrC family response regulator
VSKETYAAVWSLGREQNLEEWQMQNGQAALLVIQDQEIVLALQRTLQSLGIQTSVAQSCRQARALLQQPNPPEMVFSDPTLPDGTWAEMAASARAGAPVPVIVVSKVADYKLYITALEGGAADFIMPPFTPVDVDYVVHTAREKAAHHGQRPARPATVA